MLAISGYDWRFAYSNTLKVLDKCGVDIKESRLAQSYLQLEIVLNQTDNQFEFPILENTQSNANTGAKFPTEVRLKLQDSFFVTHVGYFLVYWESPDSESAPTGKVPAARRNIYQTYPEQYPLTTSFFSNTAMMGLWNGSLAFNIDNNVYIPKWDTQRHLHVPETQVPATFGAPPTSGFINQFSQMDGSSYGYYPMEPNIVLVGSNNNQLYLNLMEPLGTSAWTLPAYRTIKCVVKLYGFLAQNSSSLKKNLDPKNPTIQGILGGTQY